MMKHLALLISFFATQLLAQSGIPNFDLIRACADGAEVKIVLRISDQCGKPVEGACINGGITTGGGMDDFTQIDMLSDSNGIATICGRCTDKIACRITKDGYYATKLEYLCYDRNVYPPVADGRWLPYGREVAIKLKKILKPSITGGHVADQSIPVSGKWIGYDLEVRDWTAPYGAGVCDDVLIRYLCERKSWRDFNCKMELSFENWPYGGVIEMPKETFSEMQSEYEAPTNIPYKATIEFEISRTAKKRLKNITLDEQSYLIFRTRTTTNETGQLMKAHYGRIDGGWSFGPNPVVTVGGIYFNSKENDANLEDNVTAERSLDRAFWRKKLKLERLEDEQNRRERQREEARFTDGQTGGN